MSIPETVADQLALPTFGDPESSLVSAAWAVAKHGQLACISEAETGLVEAAAHVQPPIASQQINDAVRDGEDPLGSMLMRIRSADQRRVTGAIYTPQPLAESMIGWAARHSNIIRVIDPGCGSGRFMLAAGKVLQEAALVGVEADPLAALLARANLTAAGLDGRSEIIVDDYRAVELPAVHGRTAFVGNPPYVRHHDIDSASKEWFSATAQAMGADTNGLAGMHIHFLLATAALAQQGDIGCFVTAAEWLDARYGCVARGLLCGQLGGQSVHVIDSVDGRVFENADSTAAVLCFHAGETQSPIRLGSVDDIDSLGAFDAGTVFSRERLLAENRWSSLLRPAKPTPAHWVELGEIVRVHRGLLTGSNDLWVVHLRRSMIPERLLTPVVSSAKDLFRIEDGFLCDSTTLRCLIDLPDDLDLLHDSEREAVEQFLDAARAQGVLTSWAALNRKSWWALRPRAPAPIIATYMARRPPAFVRNMVDAVHLNIAHGLYPREPMSADQLDQLAACLREVATTDEGRMYAGGLAKFEPSDMARIRVPYMSDVPMPPLVPEEKG